MSKREAVPKHSLPPQKQILSYMGRFINCPYAPDTEAAGGSFSMQGSTVSAEIADAGSSYIFSGALQPMRVMAFFSTARVVSASFSRASSTGFSSPLMRQAA